MLYYKVKPEYDQCYKNPRVHNDDIYIANELLMPAEMEREHLRYDFCDPVVISPEDTYWCFGALFAVEAD